MNVVASIAFSYKIVEAFTAVGAKVSNDGESNPVRRKFLKDLSSHARFQVKKIGCDVFLMKNDLVECLKVKVS